MITQLKFQNFKALKNAELKLGAFNVIVGPNGSGKSSVLQGLAALANPDQMQFEKVVTAGTGAQKSSISAKLNPGKRPDGVRLNIAMDGNSFTPMHEEAGIGTNGVNLSAMHSELQKIKVFSFEASSLGRAVDSKNWTTLNHDGTNLAGALTHLRDKDDDAFNQLLDEFRRWIPEYHSIGFENDQNGYRNLTLKQKASRQAIPASQASEGTLLVLALLTIVHQPTPPVLIALEEPDRGLHPRLLRELRDALYRLAFPIDFGIKRAPVQVVVTTHSPFFLDLFKDHPEQVIIAEKQKDGTATFKNLSEDKELRDLIGDAPLGEVWYSGVLGGVPVPA